MGNAPESMVDPNGTSPGFGNELFANNPVENSFNGGEGTSGSGASGGSGSGGDQNLGTGGEATAGGGWDYGANGSAASKISNDNTEKADDMTGYDAAQGTSETPMMERKVLRDHLMKPKNMAIFQKLQHGI
jgi:hypothetical protein